MYGKPCLQTEDAHVSSCRAGYEEAIVDKPADMLSL
jgi:hypothetical protein